MAYAQHAGNSDNVWMDTLSDEVRCASSVGEVVSALGAALQERGGMTFCGFSEVDLQQGQITVLSSWRPNGQEDVRTTFRARECFGADFAETCSKGDSYVSSDHAGGLNCLTQTEHGPLPRAFVTVPLLKNGAWKYCLTVGVDRPHHWRSEELNLIEASCRSVFPKLDRLRTDEALRESEDKYRMVFQSMDEGFCILQLLFDDEGVPIDYLYLEANPAFELQTGLVAPRGKRIREMVPGIEQSWCDIYGNVAVTGTPRRFVDHAVSMGRWFDVYAFRVGRPQDRQVALLFTDITGRKKAEEALRGSEERLRSVLENMSEGLMLFDRAGNLIHQNAASLRIHGFDAEGARQLGREQVPITWEAWDQAGRAVTFDKWPVSRVLRGERFQDQILRVRGVENGRKFYASYNGCPIVGADGTITLGFITIRDITEQVLAQEALTKNERRLRTFFESEMMGAIYWNMDGRITGANSRFLRMVGYSREEVVSGQVSWTAMTPPEYQAADAHALEELRARGVDTAYEKEYITKDGRRVPILIGAAMLDEDRFEGVAFVLDITERRRAEREAHELQRRLDAALLAGEVGTFEWRVAEDSLWGDKNFSRIFGLPLDGNGAAPLAEFIGRIHPDDRHEVRARIAETVESGAPYLAEYRILRDVGVRWVVVRGTGERDASGKVVRFPGVLIDITERKLTEEALRTSEQQFRALAESMPQLVWTTSAQGEVDYVNGRWRAYTGQDTEDARLGRWLAALHPDDLARTRSVWDAAIAEGSLYEIEYRLLGTDGIYRWFLARAVPLKDAAGQIVRWFGTTTDIDEHKQILEELQQSQQELRRAKEELDLANAELELKVSERTARLRETVAELEHFSYTITHDMRAPLRAMHAFGQLLGEEYAHCLDGRGNDYLRRIIQSAGRMDSLITDSLDYAKAVQSELLLEPVDPGPLLRGIVESYPNFHAPGATIELAPRFPLVFANPAGLIQCFSNLLGNAVKFVSPGTVPHVRVWGEEHGDTVRLSFEDNGIGVPEGQRERIFGMFQRLSRTYEGTGVGLALVRKMAEKMRGRVGVEPAAGGGSLFWLELLRAPPIAG